MAECLRKACPCLEGLWQRVFRDKKAAPEDQGGGGDGGEEEPPGPPHPGPPHPEPPDPGPTETDVIYTAAWSFEGSHPGELTFQEGDMFCVTERSGGWWAARRIERNGRVLGTGLVPGNYLVRADTVEVEP